MARKSWEDEEIRGTSKEEGEKKKLGVFLPSETSVCIGT